MKRIIAVLGICILAGCASSTGGKKIVIWEGENVPRNYDVLGPVSVTEQIPEKTEDAIQGLAGFISRDGRISDQVPPDLKAAFEARREVYKERIFEKLGDKAKDYDADAVMGATYTYVPSFATFSTKATVTAKGTMIKYR